MNAEPPPDADAAPAEEGRAPDADRGDEQRASPGTGALRASQVETRVEGRGTEFDPQSDEWLVGRAREGDPDAWEVLIRRHRDRIYRIALRMLNDPDDAEDVTQDVAVQLLTALAGFAGGSSFTTWLYRIVINRSLNHRRRRRPTRPIVESDHPVSAGPEQAVLARGRMEAATVSLAALPSPLRVALVLHEMEGLTYQEIATILDVPESTVRGRIHRARRVLLDELRGWT